MSLTAARHRARSFTRGLPLALAAILAACAPKPRAATTPAAPASAAATAPTPPAKRTLKLVGGFDGVSDRLKVDPVADAADAVRARDFVAAHQLLDPLIAHVPAGWQPQVRTGHRIELAAWTFAEVADLAATAASDPTIDEIAWVGPSYARAYHLLGYIAVEQGNLAEAARLLDLGLALQAHPDLLSERGTVAIQQRQPAVALGLFTRASTSPAASDAQLARAWRGRGTALIDLGRLDEAQAAFTRSLTLEPGNSLAPQELEYIRKLRAGEVAPVDAELVK
jgi:tetratricopeptide (TPR) repeat protein